MMTSFEDREDVFEGHRPELTAKFRSNNSIPNISKPFWKDSRHLAGQFSYLSISAPLTRIVDENFETQFGHLEEYLRDQNKTVEFHDQMEDIERTCQVESNGSLTLKYLHLLRAACKHFDKATGAELVRLADDAAQVSGSPHFYAEKVNNDYVCEVWVEDTKLLGNLSLSTAISSYLHLCFSFDLKYPKGGETMSDLLQHGFARYGKNTGTAATAATF